MFFSKTIILYINLFLLLTLLEIKTSWGQTELERDSICEVICESLKSNSYLSNEKRMKISFYSKVNRYAENFENSDSIINGIYIRLQKDCEEFYDLVKVINKQEKGDWIRHFKKPSAIKKERKCKSFSKLRHFHYLEPSGDTVNVEISKFYWMDNFKDGTYSKLKFKWLNKCQFELTFEESNNRIRKNFSNKGDTYLYEIIEKTKHYYLILLTYPGMEYFFTFKMYSKSGKLRFKRD